MNRIRNIQILFLLGAAALLSACTSVTTTVPSGRAPAFEARADQVVVIDPADVAAELHTQVEPLLAETAGRDRVIVVSYSLAPSDETLRSVLDFIKMRTAPGDVVKVERDFIAHLGLAVTVRDPKVSAYHATARNLAQQAAEPSDLEMPRALGDPNPQAAIGAVDRYQRGSVRPFGDVSLEAGGGKSK